MLYVIEFDPYEDRDLWCEYTIEVDHIVTAIAAAQRIALNTGIPSGCEIQVGEQTHPTYRWEGNKLAVKGGRTIITWEGSVQSAERFERESLKDWAQRSHELYYGFGMALDRY